ncbi:MAG: hypothetical protein A2383_03900 [Candidatus Pacebacteria bacterium RIFOXYB1_FULL_39_46]|nr:MAG: hypothetical protein A2182_04155 [Candidatus Pacebacteria bacterium RIFOXYA1_FULL_38_18]OGJ38556.1 MAG: hypothetical protein A2383_03900 [Candidatus Pacebacteria bacterium RIFOXYB1_FULL_39_46]OGJ40416.1 MAG: hypothetical protein A2411_04040 [Candidatus Pacebacteria bacterium RIFOXYC1_FULL_39_21]OGJ40535.1 MAG: hypothetical protein A2582_02785 [Candidatus Pacebacteria bacterium RIFOXYD1_FULL_39_27]
MAERLTFNSGPFLENSVRDSIEAEIKALQKRIDSGNLSEKEVACYQRRIERLNNQLIKK